MIPIADRAIQSLRASLAEIYNAAHDARVDSLKQIIDQISKLPPGLADVVMKETLDFVNREGFSEPTLERAGVIVEAIISQTEELGQIPVKSQAAAVSAVFNLETSLKTLPAEERSEVLQEEASAIVLMAFALTQAKKADANTVIQAVVDETRLLVNENQVLIQAIQKEQITAESATEIIQKTVEVLNTVVTGAAQTGKIDVQTTVRMAEAAEDFVRSEIAVLNQALTATEPNVAAAVSIFESALDFENNLVAEITARIVNGADANIAVALLERIAENPGMINQMLETLETEEAGTFAAETLIKEIGALTVWELPAP